MIFSRLHMRVVYFFFITCTAVLQLLIINNNTAAFQKATVNNGMIPHVAEEARQDV